jgi:hypothetical protein
VILMRVKMLYIFVRGSRNSGFEKKRNFERGGGR